MTTELIEITTASLPATSRMPRILTIAGSDSSGGAGIEADLKTFSAHGCYGLTCMSVLTAQNTEGVYDVHSVPEEFIAQALDANLDDIDIDVIKTGVLTVPAVYALKQALVKHNFRPKPLIIDPVMVSTSGYALSESECLKVCIDELFPLATIVTPNIEEAYKILTAFGEEPSEKTLTSFEELKAMALRIHQLTKCAVVLLKGGHSPWAHQQGSGSRYITDVLYESTTNQFTVYKSDYIETTNLHGTGCTLSSAISSQLAHGVETKEAIAAAIKYVHNAVLTADLTIGGGNGPLNHLFNVSTAGMAATAATLDTEAFTEGTVLSSLLTHPKVSLVWKEYINHDFVRQVASRTLPEASFVYFLRQDYVYLISYAQVHALAASLAPTMEIMLNETRTITNISVEMDRHTAKLTARGITDYKDIRAGPACTNYLNYFRNIARDGEWADIHLALAPCLFGYGYAGKWGMKLNKATDEADEYYQWLQDYVSPWFMEACAKGQQTIEECFARASPETIERYVGIFADVCQLEVDFWSEALAAATVQHDAE
ncbi:hypothetical protein BABINDRAFT_163367 [Babjeviella inositovora NRRL Y-12698]|uniref:Pyridoxamine kinase/Phosphomethylpyrimidine kinase domain-containing protein n=1 Tax=Babjeviella inositovora NRRL Y-12698 TaxID=984486 RepID=A0A1E3QIX8_9ASCO|nr:uncharacterized protein BABINDRAFT_163367 [Babjeviella inositovora NRRL Y-12698]ODQ77651.1 hypothetical protein BABINDRAFT_163367 [Babjeviella inositovora NRRL Y-12698]